MGLGLNISRPEQVARLEAHSMPGGVAAADLATGAAAGALAAGDVTTTKLAAGAATLPKVSFTGLKTLAHAGKNGSGAVTLTGAVIGDRVISIFGAPTAGGVLAVKVPGTDFESVITVTDQVQQIPAVDLSASTFVFLLAPATA